MGRRGLGCLSWDGGIGVDGMGWGWVERAGKVDGWMEMEGMEGEMPRWRGGG